MSSRLRSFAVINHPNTGARPDPSVAIDLADTDRGFLPNRLTTDQRDAIDSPPEGLTIYNTDVDAYQFFDGSSWNAIGIGGGPDDDSPDSGIVKLVSGAITVPVAYLDLELPSGYIEFWLSLWGFRLQPASGPVPDSHNQLDLNGVFSFDGGTTFFSDQENFDSYGGNFGYWSTNNTNSIGNNGTWDWDSLMQFDASNFTVQSGFFRMRPGTTEFPFHIRGMTDSYSAVIGSSSPKWWSEDYAAWINPYATNPPPAGTPNLLRLFPGDNSVDFNPPTSGITIVNGVYTMWGVPQ